MATVHRASLSSWALPIPPATVLPHGPFGLSMDAGDGFGPPSNLGAGRGMQRCTCLARLAKEPTGPALAARAPPTEQRVPQPGFQTASTWQRPSARPTVHT